MRSHRMAAVLAVGALLGPATAQADPGPALSLDASADRHAISQDIYGLNYADPLLAQQIGLPVERWGGNTTDTYNWRLHSFNLGQDWYHENIADCWNDAAGYCHGGDGPNPPAYVDFIDHDRSIGARTLLTLPMMGYVAKDAPLDHPLTCGFPKSVDSAQQSYDPYDSNCGNGFHTGGAPVPASPTRAGVAITPQFNADWIADLVGRYGNASQGGVGLYELGNEPQLWNSTHRGMHPSPTTYDELWTKSRDLALAIRAGDPSAKILGPAEWGWPAYFCSAADNTNDGCQANDADRGAHGGVPLTDWYLRQFRDYKNATGKRLLDYLDLHYYRQGGSTTDVTRSLWDPTYTDPSWIGEVIRMIPRMRDWVAANYPGTKISLSEYDLSVGNDVLDTLIEADALGIFARERLDLATMWGGPAATDKEADAFRLYRNYNGAGGRFGTTWVRSTSADQGKLAVYGAQRASDGALTVAVINKTTTPLTSHLSLTGLTPGPAAQRWEWAGTSIARVADLPTGGGLDATYPARSMTLLVIPAAATLSSSGGTITYTAPPGQGNRPVLDRVGTELRISDAHAGDMVVSSPCTRVSASEARCPAAGITSVDVRAGDLNDTLTSKLAAGDAAQATLRGMEGNDTLVGGTDADTFDGGTGTDTISYAARKGRVAVKLDGARNDGADPNGDGSSSAGEEGDLDTAVENVTGSKAGDVLAAPLANSVVNLLRGGDGDDKLRAREGTATVDRLFCDAGNDRYDNDPSDTLSACEVDETP